MSIWSVSKWIMSFIFIIYILYLHIDGKLSHSYNVVIVKILYIHIRRKRLNWTKSRKPFCKQICLTVLLGFFTHAIWWLNTKLQLYFSDEGGVELLINIETSVCRSMKYYSKARRETVPVNIRYGAINIWNWALQPSFHYRNIIYEYCCILFCIDCFVFSLHWNIYNLIMTHI